jgi:tetratricopeptide (TPR) repeat protein
MKLQRLAAIAVLVLAQAIAFVHESRSDTYLELVTRANERSQAQDWAAAAPLWERVVEINPTVANFWYALGTAWLNAREYRKAIPALEKARELGAGSINFKPAWDIARAYGLLGEKESTLEWLQRALEDDGFRSRERIRTDDAFAFLRDDARFKKLTDPIESKGNSRADGWRSDLSFLEMEFERMHYGRFGKVSQADFEGAIHTLSDEVEKLSDNQIRVRIMRLMAMIGDGHTGCYPDMVPDWTKTVPLQFQMYPDGVYIISADSTQADLVGAKVLRFGDHTAERVIEALDPIISQDNAQGLWRTGPSEMRYPQILNGLGLLPNAEEIPLTIRDAKGKQRKVTVAAAPTDPQFNRILGHPRWATPYDKAPGPLPLYLKDRRKFYWFEPMPDGKSVYCQFNSVSDGSNETLSGFADSLFEYIAANHIEKLIIDMRWNNGGNSRLLPPLITGLIRSDVNRNDHLFVIVGRYTYSAAMNAATLMERFTNATFVGEPTPSSPNFVGESNIVTLPYSRTSVSISDLFWQSSWPTDRRTWIAPFVYTPPSFEAYKAKRDPAMEAILTYGQGD